MICIVSKSGSDQDALAGQGSAVFQSFLPVGFMIPSRSVFNKAAR